MENTPMGASMKNDPRRFPFAGTYEKHILMRESRFPQVAITLRRRLPGALIPTQITVGHTNFSRRLNDNWTEIKNTEP